MTAAQTRPMTEAAKPKVNPIDPEALRTELLRPLPRITWRSALVIALLVGVLAWSLAGVGPSPANRVTTIFDPFIAMGNLIVRMLPPELEVDRVRHVSIQVFGTQLAQFTIERTTIDVFGQPWVVGWPPIISSVFETVQMAIIGTLGAVLMALPLSVLAARNTSPHSTIYLTTRLILNFLRAIPELVFALLFVAAVGLGPFTGVLALAFGSVGSLARIFGEAIEQIDPAQVNAVRATGASGLQTFVYAVLPQAVPLFISYTIIYFESNVRHATILGLVGAGGVGFLLFKYTGTSDYPKVLGAALVLVIAVTIIDRFSSWLRARFI
jgi:phosphonate transport system permease protein